MTQTFTGSGKMICPICLSRSIVILALAGLRPPLHGEPNRVIKYRCEQGHTFATVSIFDGTRYQEYYAPYVAIMSEIIICWD